MIKLYDSSGIRSGGLDRYDNLTIEEEVNQLNVLSFDLPKELGELIEHEGYVEIKDEGRYVIKEKNLKKEVYDIVSLYDLEDLHAYIESKAYLSLPATAMMADLLTGTGWTFETSDTRVRTATGVTIDRLDFIYAILRDTFGLEIKFDNQLKMIKAEAVLGADRGVYFHDEVNLEEITEEADTYDFATRIIPRGKDGLSIEAINGGLPYLENMTYSNKIITHYWSDERYTVIENLKAAAQAKLDVWSKPLKSYSVSVVDLAKISDISILAYAVGDTIELRDRESGIREKQRIILRKKYPDHPEKDRVTIANRMRQVSDSTQEAFDGMRQDFSVIRANLQLLEKSVEAKVSKNAYDEDKEAMDNSYAAFKLEYDQFTVTVQSGGGNNLIKNSVGYAGERFWDVISGEFETTRSTWVLEGTSKHGLKLLGNAYFEQPLKFITGETYTLSARVKKTAPGQLIISIDDLGAAYISKALDLAPGETYDGVISHEFIYAGGAFDPGLALATIGVDADTEITDLMLAKGENINYWTQANGEVYTLQVQTDEDGVRVFRTDGKGYTIMSPEEFAGYYNNQKIFTLNGDITEVMGLEIKGKGLWLRPVKIVQTSSSIDFVWTGV